MTNLLQYCLLSPNVERITNIYFPVPWRGFRPADCRTAPASHLSWPVSPCCWLACQSCARTRRSRSSARMKIIFGCFLCPPTSWERQQRARPRLFPPRKLGFPLMQYNSSSSHNMTWFAINIYLTSESLYCVMATKYHVGQFYSISGHPSHWTINQGCGDRIGYRYNNQQDIYLEIRERWFLVKTKTKD